MSFSVRPKSSCLNIGLPRDSMMPLAYCVLVALGMIEHTKEARKEKHRTLRSSDPLHRILRYPLDPTVNRKCRNRQATSTAVMV